MHVFFVHLNQKADVNLTHFSRSDFDFESMYELVDFLSMPYRKFIFNFKIKKLFNMR